MELHDLSLNLGTLCQCCDYHSYKLPEVEGMTASQRQVIEDLCRTCLEKFHPEVLLSVNQ